MQLLRKQLQIVKSKYLYNRFTRFLALPGRAWVGTKEISRTISSVCSWLIKSREYTNFTYEISESNLKKLSFWISVVTDISVDSASRYISEIMEDETFKLQLETRTRISRYRGVSDRQIHFGRRVGWYALIRIVQPQLVVETGTDKGLGAAVILQALKRNGHGKLITIDINQKSGFYFRIKNTMMILKYGWGIH